MTVTDEGKQEYTITYQTRDGETGIWKGQSWEVKGDRDSALGKLVNVVRENDPDEPVVNAWATEDEEAGG